MRTPAHPNLFSHLLFYPPIVPSILSLLNHPSNVYPLISGEDDNEDGNSRRGEAPTEDRPTGSQEIKAKNETIKKQERNQRPEEGT